jgi:hypothetical protein
VSTTRNPASRAADRVSKAFCSAVERSELTQALPQFQSEPFGLRLGEVPAARRAYALHMAYPWLSWPEISGQLARDHGLYDGRWKPFRCKRLRRLTAAYQRCVEAGFEPAPETIFGD